MTDSAAVPASRGARLWGAYRMRLKRRRLLWRALRSRHQLKAPTRPAIPRDGVLAFVVLRNEAARLPYFLDHYRDLGVAHFLMIDNGSDDGSTEMLAAQPDVTLWQTSASYRASRFGLDWLNWLLWRHGHGRWCLTVDADELLVYDQMETRKLPALTDQLERKARKGFGTLMLDMFPNLRARADNPAGVLSGGEKQMLTMCRTLMGDPELIIIDEPTEGLAPVIVQQIGRTIQALKDEGFTIILVEQNFRFAASVADRHYVVEQGRVVDMIPNADLDANIDKLHAYLGV